jgi:hypothetical protein
MNKRHFNVDMIVSTEMDIKEDKITDMFITWCELNDWTCAGIIHEHRESVV